MTDRVRTSYQCLLAVAAVAVFYTNLPPFLYMKLGFFESPKGWILLFTAGSVPFLFLQVFGWRFKECLVLAWCAFYVWTAGLYFFHAADPEAASQEFRYHFITVLMLVSLLLVLAAPAAVLAARRTMVLAVAAGAVINIYELFHPGMFSVYPGRAAGLYLNPNIAGIALVLGMVLTVSIVPQSFRLAYMVLVGAGVVMTLSRGGIMGWCLAVALSAAGGFVSLRQIVVGVIIAVVVIASIVIPNVDTFLTLFDQLGNTQIVEGRVFWFLNPSLGETAYDEDAGSRANAVAMAWARFAESPLWGHGTGAALSQQELTNLGSHNIYLKLMTDHGILGAFIFPLLLLAAVWGAQGAVRSTALTFAAVAALFALSSHNMLEEFPFLTLLPIVATEVRLSRTDTRIEDEADSAEGSALAPA